MKKPDWLIAGLGNPGSKYTNNRHNIGWMVAAALCDKHKRPVMPMSNIYYLSSVRFAQKLAVVAFPTTFMNKSGEAVRKIARDFEIPVNRIVVVVDEFNFDIGRIHLKAGGGDGGHNGVLSVIEELESVDFFRLRCGIGNNFGTGELVEYVLSDFNENELFLKNTMIYKAVDALECLLRIGADRAMSEINSGRLWNEEELKSESNP